MGLYLSNPRDLGLVVKIFREEASMGLKFIGSVNRSLTGIDVSSSAVKLLEFDRKNDQIVLKSLAVSQLNDHASDEGGKVDSLPIINSIKTARSQSKTQSVNAAILVSGASVATKEITMDAGLSDSDMESQAWVEASNHFPDLIENLSLDFQILGINKDDHSRIDVMLVACRQNKIEEQVDLIEEGGFKAKIVDVDFYALQRASQLITNDLMTTDDNKTIAFINIGKKNATFIVLRNGQLVFSKAQAVSVSQMYSQACQKIEVDNWLLGYAAKAGSLDVAAADELLALMVPSVVVQMRQFLQYFYSENSENHVDQIVLSGEAAILKGIGDRVAEQIHTPVLIANPFKNMEFSKKIQADFANNIAPAFMLCGGLALRGMQNDQY